MWGIPLAEVCTFAAGQAVGLHIPADPSLKKQLKYTWVTQFEV